MTKLINNALLFFLRVPYLNNNIIQTESSNTKIKQKMNFSTVAWKKQVPDEVKIHDKKSRNPNRIVIKVRDFFNIL